MLSLSDFNFHIISITRKPTATAPRIPRMRAAKKVPAIAPALEEETVEGESVEEEFVGPKLLERESTRRGHEESTQSAWSSM